MQPTLTALALARAVRVSKRAQVLLTRTLAASERAAITEVELEASNVRAILTSGLGEALAMSVEDLDGRVRVGASRLDAIENALRGRGTPKP